MDQDFLSPLKTADTLMICKPDVFQTSWEVSEPFTHEH